MPGASAGGTSGLAVADGASPAGIQALVAVAAIQPMVLTGVRAAVTARERVGAYGVSGGRDVAVFLSWSGFGASAG